MRRLQQRLVEERRQHYPPPITRDAEAGAKLREQLMRERAIVLEGGEL
jgi:hypothetical protein